MPALPPSAQKSTCATVTQPTVPAGASIGPGSIRSYLRSDTIRDRVVTSLADLRRPARRSDPEGGSSGGSVLRVERRKVTFSVLIDTWDRSPPAGARAVRGIAVSPV